MCQLTKKLVLFNYMIDKWVELQAKKDNPTMEIAEAKKVAIKDFSTTRFMKLLYFTCLESAFDNNRNYQKDNLFKHFDNWVAYGNGPVEQSVYNHKHQLKTISKNEKFEYIENPEENLQTLIKREGLENYITMIDESIDRLTNNKGKSIPFDTNDDVEKLIWISHGELWNVAQWARDKKLFIDDEYLLESEIKSFDKRKEHLMVAVAA